MAGGDGYATFDDRRDAPSAAAAFWARWGAAITTVGSVALSVFMLWHQIDLSLEMQAARIGALQRQVEVMQTQIDRLESRIYEHTVSDARPSK